MEVQIIQKVMASYKFLTVIEVLERVPILNEIYLCNFTYMLVPMMFIIISHTYCSIVAV